MVAIDKPFRVRPRLSPETAFFWQSGSDGRLRFLRCRSCGYYIHPPAPVCPSCLDRDVAPALVSGRATVLSFTVNHQDWDGSGGPPYVIAVVRLDEQDDLRLTTNVVGCEPEAVSIGMVVEVEFEQHGDVFVPLFRPATTSGSSR